MRLVSAPRWAISFADLALLLLGCFVMLNALRPAGSGFAAPAPDLAPTLELGASELFEPGEARMTAAGRARMAAIARQSAGAHVTLVSYGRDGGGGRLDSFELAAARTAAVARALGTDGGDVSASVTDAAGEGAGQRIALRIER